MHEMGIAMEVLRIARDEARAAAGGRLLGLKLRVGRWSGVETESLRFALTALTDDTDLHGCRVEIEAVEPTLRCAGCGRTFAAESYFDPCPGCGGAGSELASGDELTLAELEVDDP